MQPDPARFLTMPFVRRCVIPTTEPAPQRWPTPRWPFGVLRPTSAFATYLPSVRPKVEAKFEEVERWNANRVSGGDMERPEPGAWSDGAPLPWLRE